MSHPPIPPPPPNTTPFALPEDNYDPAPTKLPPAVGRGACLQCSREYAFRAIHFGRWVQCQWCSKWQRLHGQPAAPGIEPTIEPPDELPNIKFWLINIAALLLLIFFALLCGGCQIILPR